MGNRKNGHMGSKNNQRGNRKLKNLMLKTSRNLSLLIPVSAADHCMNYYF